MKRLTVLLACLASASVLAAPKPRLVVVISIDQFRADYIGRFRENYLPPKQGKNVGGFRYLTEQGAYFTDAHHGHVPTATGPGHAALLTGSAPSLHGIIANDWIDRATGKIVYCCDDANVETIGGPSKPMSPRNLLTSTVGDELKLATNGKAKVVGVALKDRAAILMAGHAADTVLWFDNAPAGWVSSTFYFSSKTLPNWVQQLNSEAQPKSFIGKTWTPLLEPSQYAMARPAPFVKTAEPFSHEIKGITNFWLSPYGNEFTLATAKRAIAAEKLGKDEVPDLLCVSLSSNDYVGHFYGPNSPDVMDMCIRTDRQLSDFLNWVDKSVGLGNTVVVLSADHGVVPIVEEAVALRMNAIRLDAKAMRAKLEQSLDAGLGEGDWVQGIAEQHVYLNLATISSKLLTREAVETKAAEILSADPGLQVVLTRTQIMRGAVPATHWTEMATRSLHPQLSGDLFIFERPGYYFGGGTGTGHGSPWDYDSHVPIVFCGPGINRVRSSRRVYTQDIASTLCTLLGIEYTTGNMGKVLIESLDSR